MTKPKAKRAEGPFHFSKGGLDVLKTLFAPSGSYVAFYYPVLLPEQANRFLADWIKSKEGRAWVKSVLGGEI